MVYMQDIRCPHCQRWLCKATFSALEMVCRCKTRIFATPEETLIMVTAASVSRTFDGRLYVNGMLMT